MATLPDFAMVVDSVAKEASQSFAWPEVALVLRTGSREGDRRRIARHLHQMSTAHAIHYRRANFVKLAYLGRFFVTEARDRNPLGIAAAARASLEAHVHVRFIEGRLAAIVARASAEWRKRGEEFFAQVIRARFATKDATKSAALASVGLSRTSMTPYAVADCVADAKRRFPETLWWLAEHYAVLCDYVHTNLSSQTVAAVEMREAKELRFESGGGLQLRTQAPIVRYSFPSPVHAELLLEATLERAFVEYQDALAAINSTPETPFRENELVELAGNKYGFEVRREPGESH